MTDFYILEDGSGAYMTEDNAYGLRLERLTYAATIVADSPIAYWRLGEASGTTANDEMGTADGTYANTPTLGVTGLLTDDADTAVTFARTSNEHVYVSTGIPAGSSDGASFEAWIKVPATMDEVLYTIIAWGSQGSGLGYHWLYAYESGSSKGLDWQYRDSTNFRHAYSSTWTPTADATYHVVAAHDYAAETVAFYINGDLLNTTNVSAYGTPLTVAANSATYIASYSATTHVLNGTLDEVAIYDYVLTAEQVAAHYAAGTGT